MIAQLELEFLTTSWWHLLVVTSFWSYKGTNPIYTTCFFTSSYTISGKSLDEVSPDNRNINWITLVTKEVWINKQASKPVADICIVTIGNRDIARIFEEDSNSSIHYWVNKSHWETSIFNWIHNYSSFILCKNLNLLHKFIACPWLACKRLR